MAMTKREYFLLVLTILVIEFVSGYLQGFYEPLLPKFSATLSIDASELSLFNILPTAAGALLVPFLTRLGDIKGYRKLLRLAITTVFVASVIIYIGVQLSSWVLVLLGRLFFGGVPVWGPLHIALVHAKRSGQSATKAVSAIIAIVTIGTVVGTATAGPFYELLGGLNNVVIIIPVLTLAASILVWFVMPEYISGAHPHIDKLGFILLGVFMLLAIAGFVEVVGGGVDSAIGAILLVVALIVGVLWYRYEKWQEHPAIDVRIFLSRSLAPLYIGSIAMGAVFYGFLSPIATYLAHVPLLGQGTLDFGFGFEPVEQSIAQTTLLIFTVLAAVSVPFILKKISAKSSLVLGFAFGIVGFLQFALLADSLESLAAFIILVGFGTGIISAAVPVLVPQRAPRDKRGIATGLYNSSQVLGGALGGGLFLSLLKIGSIDTTDVAEAITITGYNTVWLTCAGILVVGLIIVAVFLAKPQTNPQIDQTFDDLLKCQS
jgi:MFS family permease